MPPSRLNERPIKAARVAEITGYSRRYVYQLVSKGEIPFHKRGGLKGKGAVRFFESEVRDWMMKGFVPAQDDVHAEAERLLGGCGMTVCRSRSRESASASTVRESTVLRQVEEWLTARGVWHMRCNNGAGRAQSGQFMRSFTCNGRAVTGVADIYAVKDGTSIWIECKRPAGGKLSEGQRRFLDAMNRNGAVGIVVNGIESLEAQLAEAGVRV